MPRVLLAVLVSLASLGLTPVAHSAAAVPTQNISVSGTGVAMYPSFSPATHRYGVTTTDATDGTVTVTASTTDPAGTVWVDGQPAPQGVKTLTGLASGDEISVFIKDSQGTAVYALMYLPTGFPAMTVVTKQAGIAPGDVFLTPSDFTGKTPSFETIVDDNGVPIYVRTEPNLAVPQDFKRQPDGNYSVYRPTSSYSGQVVELDDQYRQIGAYQTTGGLPNTDNHDSILLANGDRWLLSDVPNATTGYTDSVIQEQDAAGNVLFEWNSGRHVDPALDTVMPSGTADYAHINSIALMPNGDILASFRNMSQVMDIATYAHDGFTSGEIEWSLGGRRPTLSTPNDPDGGPCAQHDASVLPNGDILIFDDGSASIAGSPVLCVNPSDRTGPTIARTPSRVTEYAIDTADHTATLVQTPFQVTGRSSTFGGSAQRLPNGDTMIGWGGTRSALATEVSPDGDVLWELEDGAGLVSYRVFKYAAPDAIPPVVSVTSPAQNATYTVGQRVSSDFRCTDRGGSSLQSCSGPVAEGSRIDTSTPGRHTFTVVAKDGAGNVTKVTRAYVVGVAPFQPDALIRASSARRFVGVGVFGSDARQHIEQAIARSGGSAGSQARFVNDGERSDRLVIHGSHGTRRFRVRYSVAGVDVTRQVMAGTYRSPSLEPGGSVTVRVTVTRTGVTKAASSRTVKLLVTSRHDATRHDAVATVVRAAH